MHCLSGDHHFLGDDKMELLLTVTLMSATKASGFLSWSYGNSEKVLKLRICQQEFGGKAGMRFRL